jgi:outer membrane receptor protein involved in Fe transport
MDPLRASWVWAAAMLLTAVASAQQAAPPRAGEPSEEIVVRGAPRRGDVTDATVPATLAAGIAGTESDPIKAVENLPGLARASFGSGELIVWGSPPADTRIYVDGVEIPLLFHGNDLRSTVNRDLVQRVTLTPGAYGAEYGRALGGMVRVETKDLPPAGFHGYAAADTLDGSGMATAAVGERVRIGVAGRYGWLDAGLKAVHAPDVDAFFAVPSYGDYQAKMQVALRPRESLDAVFLGSRDRLRDVIPDPDPSQARSETTSANFQRLYLHYRRLLSDGASVEVIPFVGHDTNDLDVAFGANPAIVEQSTWRWGLRSSYRARVAEPLTLSLGLELDGSSARLFRESSLLVPPREGDVGVFGRPPGNALAADAWTAGVFDVAPYVVAGIGLGPLSVSPGLRVDGFLLQTSRQTPLVGATPSIGLEQLRALVEPRVSGRIRVTSRVALVGAAGLYSQAPDPGDLSAVFGNPSLGPERSDQASFGPSVRITESLALESLAFYKWMSDLTVRDQAPTPRLAEALLQEGVGRAYGLQILLRQQPWHGFFGWIACTLSRSERMDAPGSGWRLFDSDQPDLLAVVANKELGSWTVGLRLRYATGLPRTPVTGALYDARDDVYQPIFGPKNTLRLPAFWQLDLRVDRRFDLGRGARAILYVEGLNVTDHANAEEFVYNVDYTRRGAITGLPTVAVVGARIEE